MHILMKTSDALESFEQKKVRLAQAIGISKQAVSQWGDVVPEESALKLLRVKPMIPHEEITEAASA